MKPSMTSTIENGTNPVIPDSSVMTSPSPDSAVQLTVRLAQLAVHLEEAIFERDLAQRVLARLEKEYQAQAQNREQDADWSRDLDFARQEKEQLELEKRLLEKEMYQLRYNLAGLESERAFQRQSQSRLEQELQLSRQHTVALQAQIGSINGYLETILNSSGWRLVQSLRRVFGRAW